MKVGYHDCKIICDDHNGWVKIKSGTDKNKRFADRYLETQQAKNIMKHLKLNIKSSVYEKFGSRWTHPILYKSYYMWCNPDYMIHVLTNAPDPNMVTEPLVRHAKPGLIYVVGFEDDPTHKWVKIGRTSGTIDKRMVGLQCGHPTRTLKLLSSYCVEDAPTAELELHKKYTEYRGRGEWFQLPLDLLKLII